MVGDLENFADVDLDAAFLETLPRQRILGRLARLELAARKLPKAGQMLTFGSAREQHPSLSKITASTAAARSDAQRRCGPLRASPRSRVVALRGRDSKPDRGIDHVDLRPNQLGLCLKQCGGVDHPGLELLARHSIALSRALQPEPRRLHRRLAPRACRDSPWRPRLGSCPAAR